MDHWGAVTFGCGVALMLLAMFVRGVPMGWFALGGMAAAVGFWAMVIA